MNLFYGFLFLLQHLSFIFVLFTGTPLRDLTVHPQTARALFSHGYTCMYNAPKKHAHALHTPANVSTPWALCLPPSGTLSSVIFLNAL